MNKDHHGRRFDHDRPCANTYSILARDRETGELGAAVQSHWFSVGSVVIWGEAGVGVVATQSFVDPSYGKKGLMALKKGMSPEEAVAKLTSADERREMRQVAILDRLGRGASFTGSRCVPAAGHQVGEDHTVQANMMLSSKVWPAMSRAFVRTKGPLAERMLAALEGAERSGGDIRGRQSAALLVVKGRSSRKPWEDRTMDLRVDDHIEPVKELRRLLRVHRAYERMNQGDLAMEKGQMDQARDHYHAAEIMFPENEEMMFWHAVTLANNHCLEEALPLFISVFQRNEHYLDLIDRLVPLGLIKLDKADLRRLREAL